MPFRRPLFSALLVTTILAATSISQQKPDDPRWILNPTVETDSPPPQPNPYFRQSTTSRVLHTPVGTLTVEPNIRPRPNTGFHQSEVGIASHPHNRNIMFGASHNIRTSWINVATFITTDGGVTWYGGDTLNNTNTQRGDPAPVIDKNGHFIYGHLNSSTNFGAVTGMGMNYSTDRGITWSPTIPIVNAGGSDADKNLIGTDDTPTSPFYGNTYMAWTKFTAGNLPAVILVTRTTDGGLTWSAAQQVNTASSSSFSQGADVAVGPNGHAYISWAEESNTSPYPSVSVGFAKSTDGGATWTFTNTAYPTSGMRSASFNGWGVRVNDFPRIAVDKSAGPRRGWIYIVQPERGGSVAGSDADITLRRSTDGGTTWSSGVRVNQDAMNNGKVQFFPAITVDDGGGINVVYYDNRNYANTGDSCEIYMSRSIDGGNTWTDIKVSDHSFRPKNVPGVNSMGDYIGITTGNGKVWPVWMDDRSGMYDVWTSGINVADPTDPNPPTDVAAFSDFSTPTSMRLTWRKPTTLVNGSPIGPFVTRIKRNGVQITERPGVDSVYVDTGLTDGTSYTYTLQTRLTTNDSLSIEVQTSWTAGGSRIPASPTGLGVTAATPSGFKLKWRNPSQQTDGTRLDDLAGIRVYRNGVQIAALVRTSNDTARVDSTLDNPPAGFHSYTVTAIDSESPVNESAPSNTGETPMPLPLNDQFLAAGAPDSNRWVSTGVDVNDQGLNEPSAPFSLNLNGSPVSNSDNIESRPMDLSALQGAGVALAYFYQPGGTGDRPEVADSLIVEFRNSLGNWIAVRKYPGITSATPIPDYQFEAVGVDGVDPAGGTFFYNGFKFRFRSRGTAGTLDDDWFVDDVFFGVPTGTANIGASSVVLPTGQISNNVPVNPVVRVLNASAVQAGQYTVHMRITGPGTTYTASQADSSLAAGQARNVTFSSAFTPNGVGAWTATAWTQLTGDPSAANDTTTSVFYAVSPLTLPVQDTFPDSGAPNPLIWTNINARVNADGDAEPSAPFSLNLAGNPTGIGLDTVTSLTINLSSRAGQGVTLSYWQQPQGNGDIPESADSLVIEALNDQSGWVVLRKHPGAARRPYQFERLNLDSMNAAGGSFFHSGFKFRFRSRASTATTTRQDDWFVDDVFLGVPNAAPEMVVSPQTIADTVLVGTNDSTSYSFTIRNNNPFAGQLNYTITENPNVGWLRALPPSGGVDGGSTAIIRVAVDFSGSPAATYTTNLIVAGNDPANAADTVSIRFLVAPAPAIRATPDSFFFARNSGDSVTAQLRVRNQGFGPLTYNARVDGGYAGQTSDNIGNTENNLTTTSLLMRGGVVSVTTTVQLLEIKSYLNITNPVELRFVVYENTAATGTFTKIFETSVPGAGPGTQFYSSGPVNIVLQSGRFYAVGVNWAAGLNYFWDAGAPVPIPISFGTITGGLAQSVYPPPQTLTQNALSSLYYTQLVTARDRWLTVTSNGSGAVAPGDSTTIGFKIRTNQLGQGSNLAALSIENNDPLRPLLRVPVRLDVLTDVAENPTGIPESYGLDQNFPNPFNPTTTIRFALPEQATVSLRIYNLLGQEVVTLADGELPAAFHQVVWQGKNSSGLQVASGLYFYRLEATGHSGSTFTSLKKLVLLR